MTDEAAANTRAEVSKNFILRVWGLVVCLKTNVGATRAEFSTERVTVVSECLTGGGRINREGKGTAEAI